MEKSGLSTFSTEKSTDFVDNFIRFHGFPQKQGRAAEKNRLFLDYQSLKCEVLQNQIVENPVEVSRIDCAKPANLSTLKPAQKRYISQFTMRSRGIFAFFAAAAAREKQPTRAGLCASEEITKSRGLL